MAAGLKTCSLCGGNYRDWAKHVSSARHVRAAHPIVSRKSSRANAGRARRAAGRRQLSRRYEDEQWAHMERVERRERREAQGPRHFYGAWTPHGLSAFMGGHPGRAVRAIRKHARRHVLGKPRRSDDATY